MEGCKTAELVMPDSTTNTTKLLSEIIQEVSSLLSVEEIIEKVYERVNVLMDASVFAIGIHKQDTNELCYPADIEKVRDYRLITIR